MAAMPMQIDARTSELRGSIEAPAMRKRILNATAKLFREHGYQGTTVRQIADAVGITSGGIFYHFRTKNEILVDIVRDAATQMYERAEAKIALIVMPDEQLRALIKLELELLVSKATKDYYWVLVFEWREVPEDLKPTLGCLRHRYRNIWRRVADSCAAQGLLRCDAEGVCMMLHSAQAGGLTWIKPKGMRSLNNYAAMLAELVFV